MSAHIVNYKLIDRVVGFLQTNLGYSILTKKMKEYNLNLSPDIEHISWNLFAKKILQLNLEAVRQRYGKLSKGENEYVLSYTPKLNLYGDINQVYNHLRCLTYQMSEGNVPRKKLFKFLEALELQLAIEIANKAVDNGYEWDARD